MISIYLAGAIRDGFDCDFEWRVKAEERLKDVATIISPLHGKTYNGPKEAAGHMFDASAWTHNGFPVTNRSIFDMDKYRIQMVDVLFANMEAFDTGYPMIGTLKECMAAHIWGKLVFAVTTNPVLLHHPFVQGDVTRFFSSADECTEYLREFCKPFCERINTFCVF